MKILLTGAGGSVGHQTLQQLAKTDHDIVALDLPTRKNKRKLKKISQRVELIYGSVDDRALIQKLIRNVDAVIHLAAVIPPLADRNPSLAKQVNVDGTKAIVDAIKDINPDCFLIYSSSISVYGDRLKECWITVDDPLCPSVGDEYAITKIEAEETIRLSGIPFTIFRFSAIMGKPETDALMFNMPLDTQLEIASVRDTAKALVNALSKKDELNGRTFNLGGGEYCRTTYRDFLINMFKIYGLKLDHAPKNAFAHKNFHCGLYGDSDELEQILHFQQDDLESYYASVRAQTPGISRFFAKLFSRPIIYFLVRESEPYHALKSKDKALLNRFYDRELLSGFADN